MITRQSFVKPGETDGYIQVTPELIAELVRVEGFKDPHSEGDFAFDIPRSMWHEFLGDLDFG